MGLLKNSSCFIYTLQPPTSIGIWTENNSGNSPYSLLFCSTLLVLLPGTLSLNKLFLSSFNTNLSIDKSVMLQVTAICISFFSVPFVVCSYCTTRHLHHYSNNHCHLATLPSLCHKHVKSIFHGV